MTAMLESKKFLRMARSLTDEAMRKGLTPAKAIKLQVLGSTVQGPVIAPVRNAIVSYTTPTTNPNEIEIWVNPLGLTVAQSDPAQGTWHKVYAVEDLFSTGGNGAATTSSYSGLTVADLAELRAMVTTSMPDRTIAYVENDRMLYGFDLQANDADNPPTAIKPTTGPGTWYVLNNAGGAIGNIDGGAY